MSRFAIAVAAAAVVLVLQSSAQTQVTRHALESADGLVPHNVDVEPATLDGRNGVRVTFARETRRLLEQLPPSEQATRVVNQLASIAGLEFSNGSIEVDVAGAPAPDAPEGARGFVGIAFRLQPDNETFDAFYLRPTNGRADDQQRRNRSVQYISHPEWPWFRLREETPARYEAYVDLVPGEWTKVRIDVEGDTGRLFVHDSQQPTLIVNDLKTGAQGRGAVALWLDVGTVAHFRDLKVTPR
jgi:hypothetical protein